VVYLFSVISVVEVRRLVVDEARLVRTSKFLSKYLRHAPEQLGLSLAPGGWAGVEELLAAAAQHGMPLTRAELAEIIARNNKQRFAFDETGERIRANQGHSVAVDLQLEPVAPPALLYHGTGERAVAAIQREGLRKMRRQHVHLSPDVATAIVVGRRHGRPVVFEVRSGQLHAAGVPFYRSANGVWLVDAVPPEYLRFLAAPPPAGEPARRESGEK
jgi:putative RNA 2'-phosphotransferase